MALGDPYATRAELAARMGLTSASAAENARMDSAVATASQEIDKFCNRTFWSSVTESEREFVASSRKVVFTDDFHTTPSSVKVVEYWGDGVTVTTVLVATDWKAEPRNPDDGRPQWSLRNMRRSSPFPVGPDNGHIAVTATWGWAAVPGSVKEACLLLAEEYFKLKEAPFGVVNWGEFGPVRVTTNRRAMGLLKQYARGRAKVG